ncbi:P7 [Pseudomonas phage phi8]|uniref:p7 n=1 Tax=Pseudomonas phage phi8 TaxID=120086 RepID=Q8LTT1_9VIRU|nr:core protein [Pseudomonas phage phi8]AAM73501.1 P7 [Pseudomonas phage phi8]
MTDPITAVAINRLVDTIDRAAWASMEDEEKLGYIRRYVSDADDLGISPRMVDDVLDGISSKPVVQDDVFGEAETASSLASRLATTLTRATALRTVMVDGYRVVVGRVGELTLSARVVQEDHRQVVVGYIRVAHDVGGDEYTRMCANIARNEVDYDRITIGGDESSLEDDEQADEA